ncbi:ribonuclease HII [Lagierella massiliensis]|uniref:ribonuclease HII n=1 Tax=Lagierella massiliensis TaxID=1689303 RepID=UPI0006D7A3E5|nr:ribonuclease HII [Lagierella massiliensis]
MIIMDNDILKKYSGKLICGVDEVGRGPLAGPVVACAVIMGNEKIDGVKDSKQLSAKKREALNKEIIEKAKAIGIGVVDEKVIDEINIKQATRLAMRIAVADLKDKSGNIVRPDVVMIDAENIDMDIEQVSIIKGDELIYEISCASIVAKVLRDSYFIELDEKYPGYDFLNNKGYGTKKHREALLEMGPTPIHRKTFLKKILGGKSDN